MKPPRRAGRSAGPPSPSSPCAQINAKSVVIAVGDYPTDVPGIGHGRCVTFGRIAGINAAGGDASTEIPDLDI